MPESSDHEQVSGDAWDEEKEGGEDDISGGLPAYEQAEDYDPDADDKDQAFIDERRCNRRSDAHLSCPGCLTTVCVDCQAHAFKEGQFRAMFAINARSVCSAIPFHTHIRPLAHSPNEALALCNRGEICLMLSPPAC